MYKRVCVVTRRNIGQCLALFIRKHGPSVERGNGQGYSSRSKLAHDSSLTSLAPYANVVGCTTSRRLQLDACYAVQYTLRCKCWLRWSNEQETPSMQEHIRRRDVNRSLRDAIASKDAVRCVVLTYTLSDGARFGWQYWELTYTRLVTGWRRFVACRTVSGRWDNDSNGVIVKLCE